MKILSRVPWLLLALMTGYLWGYTAAGIEADRAIVRVNEARVEAATYHMAVLETRVGWAELARRQERCLIGQGWMQEHASPGLLAGTPNSSQAGSP